VRIDLANGNIRPGLFNRGEPGDRFRLLGGVEEVD
jgi:hypothetical protein